MKKLFGLLSIVVLRCLPFQTQAAASHGIDYSWTASTSAASCTSANNCSSSGYNLYQGPASGQETSTPVNSALITGLSYSWVAPQTVLGTTVCAYVVYQQTITTARGNITVQSAPSNEVCVTFPPAPAVAGGASGTIY